MSAWSAFPIASNDLFMWGYPSAPGKDGAREGRSTGYDLELEMLWKWRCGTSGFPLFPTRPTACPASSREPPASL
ncbi:hypothetical protein FTO68_01980 [Methanocalculus taiwanensis]|uniref:Uncharacterized protein n=1 Tax=Methanocalculus taiwanensis TaxID=106207 RepID=A0ABD4TFK6_9EURY|nr:hypothetical protein [Methanocalculus taiwanensis]MCQ1537762.1 hypothetical protein [Methanocalculus taiwanensis]